MKHEINQENNRLQGILKVQELEAKQMQFRLSQQEKLMEERRLQQDQQLEMMRAQMDQLKPSGMINVGGSSGRKSGKIITDENGNPTAIEVTHEAGPKVNKIYLDEDGNPSEIEIG